MSKRDQQHEEDEEEELTFNAPKRTKGEAEENQASTMRPRKLTHDAYTVGWICVVESELDAARALLDAEDEPLQAGANDDNIYLLGRMGQHNIVIAFPWSYGTNTAAQTAMNMIRTFTNIRFGLMVGVGGGAPRSPHSKDSRKDIRLGDIVVSEPNGNHGIYWRTNFDSLMLIAPRRRSSIRYGKIQRRRKT
jgi:nucleoside phosphorylase